MASAAFFVASVLARAGSARPADPATAPAAPAADTTPLVPGPATDAPMAGISGDVTFVRSANNLFLLFPSAQLQVDGAFVSTQSVKSGFTLRRVRLELAGWIGPGVYYTIAGDFASPPPTVADPVTQSFLATTDDYVALAPLGDLAILQAGQFDAPFTLENRISDRYTDFIERSLTVRAVGAPTNKEVGVMLHGTDDRHLGYYSAGVFNGEGPNFRNLDNQFDLIARGFFAPFGLLSVDRLKAITLGGSVWRGRHLNGLAFQSQTTAGGFVFFNPRWTTGRAPISDVELHQQGRVLAYAFEFDAPLTHRLGLRAEYVSRHQQLAEADIDTTGSGMLRTLGNATVDSFAAYGELWFWIVGDDTLLPRPGVELPVRLAAVNDGAAADGLMVALRAEFLKEDLVSDTPAIADPNVATTRVMAGTFGVNYWYSKRFRFSLNYTLNAFHGTTENIRVIVASTPYVHELLLRLAIAL
ncbi:MAG TPA: porin [Polyangia bacterium]|nr:porin [Polyangia bacterium]